VSFYARYLLKDPRDAHAGTSIIKSKESDSTEAGAHLIAMGQYWAR